MQVNVHCWLLEVVGRGSSWQQVGSIGQHAAAAAAAAHGGDDESMKMTMARRLAAVGGNRQ